jgi:sterol desaturase/sphingolipid hydroxylase (fatty acid hydroxylase superfamily)
MNGVAAVATIVFAMAILSAVEAAVPLHARGASTRAHLWPNLTLTFLTFATNLVYNAGVVALLLWLQRRDLGLLAWLKPTPPLGTAVVVVALDFSFYVAHVAMHAQPLLWRFHRVHHADPAVDVTTTIRQHPGEGVIRYIVLAAFAALLGAPVEAFAVYRMGSVLNGLLEHANLRVPRALDRLLSLVVVTPNMHKVHHSRARHETNSNYGNLFSLFDRALRTFTPTERGLTIAYGLAEFDDPRTQSTLGLLALPFRSEAAAAETNAAPISDRRRRGENGAQTRAASPTRVLT